jgi:hypothetical protein
MKNKILLIITMGFFSSLFSCNSKKVGGVSNVRLSLLGIPFLQILESIITIEGLMKNDEYPRD